jgi:hypothetical protein
MEMMEILSTYFLAEKLAKDGGEELLGIGSLA